MPNIFFVTNRNPNRKRDPDDFGPKFSSADVHDLRFGRAEVALLGGRQRVTRIEVADERLHPDPKRSKLGSSAMFLELRDRMLAGVDTVAFIHGYNVSFHEALINGAQLVEAYGDRTEISVVVFSWPSDGSMLPLLAYKSDRSDARATGPALARLLFRLRDFLASIERGQECEARIHLFAHSMGNYVLRHALQEMRRTAGGDLPFIFDQIFLMAADEDHDALELEHKLLALPELALGVNVYFNRGDTALVISDRTKLNPTRLGARGPRKPHAVPGNVNLIDVSDVVTGAIEHSYFVDDEATVRDVRQVLTGNAADRIDGRRYLAAQNRFVLE